MHNFSVSLNHQVTRLSAASLKPLLVLLLPRIRTKTILTTAPTLSPSTTTTLQVDALEAR